MAGSAVARTSVWIMLEHRGPWGAKAVLESDLATPVKDRLRSLERALEGARIQLVRRCGPNDGPLRFWLGVSDVNRPRLVEWTLPSPQAWLDLDVPALISSLRAGEDCPAGAREPTQPMLLVCTNGRRDACCAKWGVPVAQALSTIDGVDVWQTTHLGGHRFAATLLQLPAGICYGRVEPHESHGLAQAAIDGVFYRLDRVRGRTVLQPVEQAAEVIWRSRTGRLEVDALATIGQSEDDERTTVVLHDHAGLRHEVCLEYRTLKSEAPPSCGKDPVAPGGWFVASDRGKTS